MAEQHHSTHDMKAANGSYAGFITFVKVSIVVTALVTALVVVLIS